MGWGFEPSYCSPPGLQALRTWCLLQTLVFEVGTAGIIIFQQKLASSMAPGIPLEGSMSLAMFTSAGTGGLQVPKIKWSLGFQTNVQGLQIISEGSQRFLPRKGLRTEPHDAGCSGRGHRAGTLYLSGCSAP